MPLSVLMDMGTLACGVRSMATIDLADSPSIVFALTARRFIESRVKWFAEQPETWS